MNDTEKCLKSLGFSELEQKIYICLLSNGNMSAYQIAKKIDISRSSIYNCLEHMINKGMVELIPNDTAIYSAQKPDILIGKMKKEFLESAEQADELLSRYETTQYGEEYANIKGFSIILMKAADIVHNSRNEIYINTDIKLDFLESEFKKLKERGIKVIVYSFYDIGVSENYKLYTHGRPMNGDKTRLMVVADGQIALTAGIDGQGQWQGTVTGNKLFVKIISEHIHNDIYLLKLRDMYGRDMYNKLHIDTAYERRNRQ